MTDELELVRQARPEVPPPSEAARVAARKALDDAIATGRARRRRRLRTPLRLSALVPALGVLVVIAVVFVFLGIHGTKPSRPASTGGLQLVFRATSRALPINGAAMSRTQALVRLRLSSVAPGAHVSTSGDEVHVNISGGTRMSVNELVALIGSPEQLLFYDWEANVLTPNGHTAASQLQTQDPTAIKISQGSSSGPPGTPGSGSMPLYQAVTLAAKQPRQVSSDNSRQGPEYFMFGAPGSAACAAAARAQGTTPVVGAHCLLSGPDDNLTDLNSGLPSAVSASQSQVLTVQQGTAVLEAQARVKSIGTAWNNPRAQFYVLKDHVSLFGSDTTNPQQSTDQSGSPDVRFRFTSHGATQFERVTTTIAHRGKLVSGAGPPLNQHFAVALDTQLLTVPSIDFKTYPDGVPANDGADITTGLTKSTARRLAAELRLGPLPVHLTLLSSSNASAPASTSAHSNG